MTSSGSRRYVHRLAHSRYEWRMNKQIASNHIDRRQPPTRARSANSKHPTLKKEIPACRRGLGYYAHCQRRFPLSFFAVKPFSRSDDLCATGNFCLRKRNRLEHLLCTPLIAFIERTRSVGPNFEAIMYLEPSNIAPSFSALPSPACRVGRHVIPNGSCSTTQQ